MRIVHPVRVALFLSVFSAALIGTTAAVVRAETVTTMVAPPTIVPQVADPSAVVNRMLAANRPVQLPLWQHLPAGPCVAGEMAMVLTAATQNSNPRAQLNVCVGVMNNTICAQSVTTYLSSCAPSDASCTNAGGTPTSNPACTGSYRGCDLPRTTCVQYRDPLVTHWEIISHVP